MWHKYQRIILRRAAHSQRVELTDGSASGANGTDGGDAWCNGACYGYWWCLVQMVVVLVHDAWYGWCSA